MWFLSSCKIRSIIESIRITKIKEEINATKEENKELKDQNEMLEENALYGVEGEVEISNFKLPYLISILYRSYQDILLYNRFRLRFEYHKKIQSQLKSRDQQNHSNNVHGFQQKRLMVSKEYWIHLNSFDVDHIMKTVIYKLYLSLPNDLDICGVLFTLSRYILYESYWILNVMRALDVSTLLG